MVRHVGLGFERVADRDWVGVRPPKHAWVHLRRGERIEWQGWY